MHFEPILTTAWHPINHSRWKGSSYFSSVDQFHRQCAKYCVTFIPCRILRDGHTEASPLRVQSKYTLSCPDEDNFI